MEQAEIPPSASVNDAGSAIGEGSVTSAPHSYLGPGLRDLSSNNRNDNGCGNSTSITGCSSGSSNNCAAELIDVLLVSIPDIVVVPRSTLPMRISDKEYIGVLNNQVQTGACPPVAVVNANELRKFRTKSRSGPTVTDSNNNNDNNDNNNNRNSNDSADHILYGSLNKRGGLVGTLCEVRRFAVDSSGSGAEGSGDFTSEQARLWAYGMDRVRIRQVYSMPSDRGPGVLRAKVAVLNDVISQRRAMSNLMHHMNKRDDTENENKRNSISDGNNDYKRKFLASKEMHGRPQPRWVYDKYRVESLAARSYSAAIKGLSQSEKDRGSILAWGKPVERLGSKRGNIYIEEDSSLSTPIGGGAADADVDTNKNNSSRITRVDADPEGFSYYLINNIVTSISTRQSLISSDSLTVRYLSLLAHMSRPRALTCSSCGYTISRTSHRFTVNGADGVAGNYVNPHGVVHDTLTCKSLHASPASNNTGAPGALNPAESTSGCHVLLVGKPCAQDSWFPGYSWTIAACIRCNNHLGWLFTTEGKTIASVVPTANIIAYSSKYSIYNETLSNIAAQEQRVDVNYFWGFRRASLVEQEIAEDEAVIDDNSSDSSSDSVPDDEDYINDASTGSSGMGTSSDNESDSDNVYYSGDDIYNNNIDDGVDDNESNIEYSNVHEESQGSEIGNESIKNEGSSDSDSDNDKYQD